MEDGESDNASLSEISSFLSCSVDTCPPISSGLVDLINGKFNAEYSVEKSKEIFQKYKKPNNCDNVLVPKINEQTTHKCQTLRHLNFGITRHTRKSVKCY